MLSSIICLQANAQTNVNKNTKSRYYKNNVELEMNTDDGFHIDGFEKNYDKRDRRDKVERRKEKQDYEVNIRSKDEVGKYQGERKISTVKTIMTAPIEKRSKPEKTRKEEKPAIDKRSKKNTIIQNERVIYMTGNEKDYATTVVRKRYTSIDILADDLDISKYQRPVFKGICSECDTDVDAIITDKNLSSLEKNYKLKQSYMLRDKRLRETLSPQQYAKWNRIKDEDEYLILTKDPELQDGVYE